MDMLSSSGSPLYTALIFLLSSRKSRLGHTSVSCTYQCPFSTHTVRIDHSLPSINTYPSNHTPTLSAINIYAYLILIDLSAGPIE